MKILIIDDDRFYVQYLSLLLPKYFPDYDILAVTNGSDAWKAIRQNEWDKRSDLIIMDLEMPHLNGYGLIRMIKKHRDVADHCPKILINTSFKMPERQDFFSDLNCEMVPKPLHISKVRSYLGYYA